MTRPLTSTAWLLCVFVLGLPVVLAACGGDITVAQRPTSLLATPEFRDLGEVIVGSEQLFPVFLDAVGGEIAVLDVAVVNAQGDFFELAEEGDLPLIASGMEGEITLRYRPSEAGFHSATVRITSDASQEAVVEVTVRGQALDNEVGLARYVVDFGVVLAGTSGTASLAISNGAAVAASLTTAAVGGDGFGVTTELPAMVLSGEVLELELRFDAVDDEPATTDLELGLEGGVSLRTVLLRANHCIGGTPSAYDVDSDGFSTCGGDCDDADPAVHPGAIETIDGMDEDTQQTFSMTIETDEEGLGSPNRTVGADSV